MIELDFTKGGGLVTAIAQDYLTNEILMVAFIDEEAWQETLKTNYATYYSRSRKSLWRKGETSGHRQKIHQILIDCDNDAVIFKVEQLGPGACHTGHRSCFFRTVAGDDTKEIAEVVFDPDITYGDGKK